MRIFVSYSSKDREQITVLAKDLAVWFDDEDDTVWFDQALDRTGGHPWWKSILAAIRECDVFIFALSQHIVTSEPCRREHQYALALAKPVLPVKVAEVDYRDLSRTLQEAQIVDYTTRSHDQQRSLKRSLRNLPSAPPLPDPLPPPPDAPLDPIGLLRDGIANLTSDPDQQRLLIGKIEDLGEESSFAGFVPELLARLIHRDDVLTVRNLRRAQELQVRLAAYPAQPPVVAVVTPAVSTPAPVQPPQPRKPPIDILPAPFDWVSIPEGAVTLREDNYDDSYIAKGQQLARAVAPLWMARYPVTNTQFGMFIEAKGYDQRKWWTDAGWKQRQSDKWTVPLYWKDSKWNGGDFPVVGVSYHEAAAFCAWLSETTRLAIRLPGEHEWQWAAQGTAGSAYPWGDAFDPARCNTSESKIGRTSSVPQYEGRGTKGGDSEFGVTDMAGNVWEWSATQWENGDENTDGDMRRVLRGGSWSGDQVNARASFRGRSIPHDRYYLIGFRVVVGGSGS